MHPQGNLHPLHFALASPLFVVVYTFEGTPDSSLDVKGEPLLAYNEFNLDVFDFLRGVPPSETKEEIGGG
jgi:hypothetical protein